MATRPLSVLKSGDGAVVLAQWIGLKSGDDGAPIELGAWGDRSVQCAGAFSGATMRWEGSNDGVNYCQLNDAWGVALDMTSACVKCVAEISRYARPRVIGGDGSTDLQMHALIRRSGGADRVLGTEN